MDRIVTRIVALGFVPLGFAALACITASRVFLWAPRGAMLWGVAAGLLVVALGLSPCARFLEAGDHRQKQPYEVGRFVMRLFWLHALGALSVAVGYVLPATLYNAWLGLVGAACGGSLSYLVFTWIFFAAKDPRRVGRVMQTKDELVRRVKEVNEEIEKSKQEPLFFAGHWLPFKAATNHFLVMGATNTGKTLVQRMLMQSALKTIGLGLDQRAIVFDAKQDVLSILAGMNLRCPVLTLDPFDARGYAWDMAADITALTDAQTLAVNLVPIDEQATQKFFDEAVRSLFEEVIVTFIDTVPGNWTFADVINTLRDRDRLCRVLKKTTQGAELLKLCFANEETARNIMSNVHVRTNPYRSIAATWQRAKAAGRMVSLNDWLDQEYVLVLGNSHKARPAIQAINQVLFTRLKELILDQSESTTRRNWVFLDEVRQAGRLAALTDLMVEGRSKGACVVLGFQDIEGMKHVHTTHLANELIGQAHNVCFTKLVNPETAAHASENFGEYEQTEVNESFTESSGGGRSRTVSVSRAKHVAVMPSEFMSIPMPSPEKGLTFYAITTELGAYRDTMSGEDVKSILCAPNSDPEKGGMPNRVPVPDDWQRIKAWGLADYVRLKIRPPVRVLRKNLHGVPGSKPAVAPKRRAVAPKRQAVPKRRVAREPSTP